MKFRVRIITIHCLSNMKKYQGSGKKSPLSLRVEVSPNKIFRQNKTTWFFTLKEQTGKSFPLNLKQKNKSWKILQVTLKLAENGCSSTSFPFFVEKKRAKFSRLKKKPQTFNLQFARIFLRKMFLQPGKVRAFLFELSLDKASQRMKYCVQKKKSSPSKKKNFSFWFFTSTKKRSCHVTTKAENCLFLFFFSSKGKKKFGRAGKQICKILGNDTFNIFFLALSLTKVGSKPSPSKSLFCTNIPEKKNYIDQYFLGEKINTRSCWIISPTWKQDNFQNLFFFFENSKKQFFKPLFSVEKKVKNWKWRGIIPPPSSKHKSFVQEGQAIIRELQVRFLGTYPRYLILVNRIIFFINEPGGERNRSFV